MGGDPPCALTLMVISQPWVTCSFCSAGSRCVAYVPAKSASESELPGEMAASRPAVLTCMQVVSLRPCSHVTCRKCSRGFSPRCRQRWSCR